MATAVQKRARTCSLWQSNSPSQQSLQIIERNMNLWWTAGCLTTGGEFLHFTETLLVDVFILYSLSLC